MSEPAGQYSDRELLVRVGELIYKAATAELKMVTEANEEDARRSDDAGRAVRFMVVKAAIFVAVPLVAAVVVALWVLQ